MEAENISSSKRKLVFPLVIVILVVIGGFLLFSPKTSSSANPASGDNRTVMQKPVATQTVNKTFSFPLLDSKGKEVSQIKYTIESAELRNEIIVKGQKATAVQGKTFLVINLRLTNDYSKSIQINVRDYIRLMVNKSEEKLAPEIHNDPVEIQAISTKVTRVGFPINDTDKNLVLQIGEINGKKQTVTLNLK
jgi:hypothetical protein